MNGIRFLAALCAASLLLALPVAAPAQDSRPASPPQPLKPLKPGQSAGIQAAQQTHTGLALIGGGAVIAVVLVAATASSNGGSSGQVSPQVAPATTTAP